MDLTTLDRVKFIRGIGASNTDEDSILKSLITSVSALIEKSPLFDRYIRQEQRTEYFDVEDGQRIVSALGVPIASSPAPQLYNDDAREFSAGTLISTSNYYIDLNRGKFKFDRGYALVAGSGVLKIVYTGGLATVIDRMIAAVVAGGSGDFGVGETVTGASSKARGKFVGLASDVITLDVVNGVFIAGEVVTGLTSTKSRTLSSITQTPLVMAYPDLALACELQVCYIHQRKDNLGLRSVSLEGGSLSTFQSLELLPEVRQLINGYKIAR